MQSINSIEPYPYGTRKEIVREKEEIECNNIIKRYEKLVTLMILQKKKKKNVKQHNPNWPQILDHL